MDRKHRRKMKRQAAPPAPTTPPAEPPKDTTPTADDDPLTPRERRFVEEYIADPNATQAYRRAFQCKTYASAATKGHMLLKKVEVQAEIAAGQKMQAKRIRMGADQTLREVARLAFADASDLFDDEDRLLPIRKVPIHTRRAIQAVKVRRQKLFENREYVGDEDIIEVKLASKDAALGRLMKHQGLVKELPPLEVLLGLFPDHVRDGIRRLLAEEVGAGGDPDGAGQDKAGRS